MKNLNMAWFSLIFLAAVTVIALPTRTLCATSVPAEEMMGAGAILYSESVFRVDVITQHPNYLVGAFVIGVMALIGMFLNTDTATSLINKLKGEK